MASLPVHLGFLYPGHTAEDDYPRIGSMLGPEIAVSVVHTPGEEEALTEAVLRENGDIRRLREGAAELRSRGVGAAMWACTSGSFLYGLQGAQEQAQVLGEIIGAPTSSTSLAFVDAAIALGLGRVAVASPYPDDIAQAFGLFMAAAGVEVVHIASLDTTTAHEIGTLGPEHVLQLVAASDHPDADAILLPDTALHTAALLDDLESTVGKVVLTANQVTVWKALRLAGDAGAHIALGRLFANAGHVTTR